MIETNIIHLGDCVQGLKTLPDECIDLVVSDVAYPVTQRGNAGNSGGMLQKELNKKGKVFEFNSVNIEDYLHELYRVLKDGTHCYLMCNHVNLTHFLKVIDESKFHFIKCLIWQKGNLILGTKYMNAFEYILFMSKGTNRNVNDCGIPDILSVPNIKTKDIDGGNIHDSEKPVRLMEILITQSSNKGDIVLDPFAGSGSTLLACINKNRRFIGWEIDPKYHKLCEKRIKNHIVQTELF